VRGYAARETAAMFRGTLLSYTTCDSVSELRRGRPAPLLGPVLVSYPRARPPLAASALVAAALLTTMPQYPLEDLL
jgi:hypothetical protein